MVELEVCIAHRHKGSLSKLHAEYLQSAVKYQSVEHGACVFGTPAQAHITQWEGDRVAFRKECEQHFAVTVVHSVHSRTQILVAKYHLHSKDSTVLGKIVDAMAWCDK